MQSKASDENQKNEAMLYQDAVYINNIYDKIIDFLLKLNSKPMQP